MATQLTLTGSQLRDSATFASYYAGEKNQSLLQQCQLMAQGQGDLFIYIWGALGSGRSHLLQACCHQGSANGLMTMYLPMTEMQFMDPQMTESLEMNDLICIDDIDVIAGNSAWEQALFHLYNRMRDSQKPLLVSASSAANHCGFGLADLVSRLNWGAVFHLQLLSEQEKLAALQLTAKQRGFTLSEEVGQFILRRCPRNMKDLFDILERLDQASLTAQRRLTIPFIKSVLDV